MRKITQRDNQLRVRPHFAVGSFSAAAAWICLFGCGPSLKGVVQRNTAAMGGAAAIENVRNIEVTLRISERGTDLDAVYRADRPGRMRIDIYLKGQRVYTEGYDGKRAWALTADGMVKDEDPAGTAALWHGTQYPDQLFGLHELPTLGHQVALVGRQMLDGIEYLVLQLTLSDGFVTYRYINPATGLIERGRDERALHPALDSKKKWLENRWMDYRPVNGVLRSFQSQQVDVDTGAQLQVSKIERIRINLAFPSTLFERGSPPP